MNTQFPTIPEHRKALYAAMVTEAPDLMAQIAQLRRALPGLRLTHYKSESIDVGAPTDLSKAWPISDELVSQVNAAERKRNPPTEVIVAKVAAKRRTARIKKTSR